MCVSVQLVFESKDSKFSKFGWFFEKISFVSNCSKLSYMIFDAGHGFGRKPGGN